MNHSKVSKVFFSLEYMLCCGKAVLESIAGAHSVELDDDAKNHFG